VLVTCWARCWCRSAAATVFHYQISGAAETASFAQGPGFAFFGFGVANARRHRFAIDALSFGGCRCVARILSVAMVLAALAFLGLSSKASFA